MVQPSLIMGRKTGATMNAVAGQQFLDLQDCPRANIISRQHAAVVYDEQSNSFVLRCLGRNGTILNGQRYLPNTNIPGLKEGDRIKIGDVELVFHKQV